MSEVKKRVCPSCSSKELSIIYQAKNVPVNSCLLFSSQKKAINYPRGDVILGFCYSCGFITNIAFDPLKVNYSLLAPEEQGSSATFLKFANRLANRLIETYNVRRKKILEIGCGRGDFLKLLCTMGENQGVGIDPSTITGDLVFPIPSSLRFVRDYFSEKNYDSFVDLICCRHTLEHIHDTARFVKKIRQSIGTNSETISFFEVPDVSRILEEVAFWDIYYEHCSYFTLGSLARLFRLFNFEIEYLEKDYFDQYLLIDLKPINQPSKKIFETEDNIELLTKKVLDFSANSKQKIQKWKDTLKQIKKEQKKAVVWGSGSKCVGFMTTLNVLDEIEFVVDINPLRHGKFIPGVGKQIFSPEVLRNFKPDVVIIMNPVYLKEIKTDLEKMGLSPKVIPCS